MDLHDLEHNTRDGIHIASLAGAWGAAVAGFGGLRDHDGVLSFAPRLPARLERLAFRLVFRGRRLRVEVTKGEATYALAGGGPLEIRHYGKAITVAPQRAAAETIPLLAERPAPTQPPGRAPVHRGPESRE
jgi:alpha,alpha-trehalose phosphorylase